MCGSTIVTAVFVARKHIGHSLSGGKKERERRQTHFPSGSCHVVNHLLSAIEFVFIPREVPFAIGMLNIEPNEIIGNVQFIKFIGYSPDILNVIVIPSTLMVSQSRSDSKDNQSPTVYP